MAAKMKWMMEQWQPEAKRVPEAAGLYVVGGDGNLLYTLHVTGKAPFLSVDYAGDPRDGETIGHYDMMDSLRSGSLMLLGCIKSVPA